MMMKPIARTFPARLVKPLAAGVMVLSLIALAGCKTPYGASVTNKTPQPLYVQLMLKHSDGASMGASARLGPGDRRNIGPVRHDAGRGAYLVFDTLPNPNRPATVDLAEGESYFEVQQQGDASAGPLVIIQK